MNEKTLITKLGEALSLLYNAGDGTKETRDIAYEAIILYDQWCDDNDRPTLDEAPQDAAS